MLEVLEDLDPRFRIFHELMQRKIRDVLLVSTLYDACIMQEDGRLAEKIIHEYRGLNLSQPPRLTWASTAEEALRNLSEKKFDMVITTMRLGDMDAYSFGEEVKKRAPDLPVILLAHTVPEPLCTLEQLRPAGIDRTLIWTGDSYLLLALIKNAEDILNVQNDTREARVRVILVVEDSPLYLSTLLPILYREVVFQTQAVMEEGLNEEHRLLTMRARPKILVAENLEEAAAHYERYKNYLLGIMSDVRFPRQCRLEDDAGFDFLTGVRREKPDLPLLLMSSESANAARASAIPATFVNKNSPSLREDIRSFLLQHLGFGDFIFRLPDGKEIARTSNMRALENILPSIPAESFYHHWSRNDFSRWLFARSEIILASKLRPVTDADFAGDVESMRRFLIASIRERRRRRLRGVVATFDEGGDFDTDTDFLRIGNGSLGGKARGLVFASKLIEWHPELQKNFPEVDIAFPQTLILTTEVFDSFLKINDLNNSKIFNVLSDGETAEIFMEGILPPSIEEKLRHYLSRVRYPLAVRSSSLLEDSQFQPFAGLYRTCMLPNSHPELQVRLEQLTRAIKLIYASVYSEEARSFGSLTPLSTEEEKMAVIVQRLVGERYGDHFYPIVSGVGKSRNYYPVSPAKTDDGIVYLAMGFGKIIMEGEKALRFCPKYPHVLPQFSTVEDMLENSQRYYYALNMERSELKNSPNKCSAVRKRELADAEHETLKAVASTYIPEEYSVRDNPLLPGPKVITFAPFLKYRLLPLPEIVSRVLEFARSGMGCPVEVEFCLNLRKEGKPEFSILQIRPMQEDERSSEVEISEDEISRAFCFSTHSLGNGLKRNMADILYVKPSGFDRAKMAAIALEIRRFNANLTREGRKYLLMGPGRWGSADRWLGIPVDWADISGVGAIVETTIEGLNVEPSQGSHFFHNLTSLNIPYIMVQADGSDFIDWEWLNSMNLVEETDCVAHVRLDRPFFLKCDGRRSRCAAFDLPIGQEDEFVCGSEKTLRC